MQKIILFLIIVLGNTAFSCEGEEPRVYSETLRLITEEEHQWNLTEVYINGQKYFYYYGINPNAWLRFELGTPFNHQPQGKQERQYEYHNLPNMQFEWFSGSGYWELLGDEDGMMLFQDQNRTSGWGYDIEKISGDSLVLVQRQGSPPLGTQTFQYYFIKTKLPE